MILFGYNICSRGDNQQVCSLSLFCVRILRFSQAKILGFFSWLSAKKLKRQLAGSRRSANLISKNYQKSQSSLLHNPCKFFYYLWNQGFNPSITTHAAGILVAAAAELCCYKRNINFILRTEAAGAGCRGILA